MEFLFIGALAVLAAQRLIAQVHRTRKTLTKKANKGVRQVRAALGTQTVATTHRKKTRKGGVR